MKESEAPLDLTFVLELIQPPSIEEELHMEKEIRSIKSSDDINAIKRYAEDLARQNHQQSIFIAGCMNKIAELQAKLICKENPVKQREPNLLEKILKI
tara:strand:- start:1229 stop:1522 length:294 start_codon:yes stop_codon:yes gene_type:complete